jgi:antitoxin ParD1/3/4
MSLLCPFCRLERLTAFNVEKAQAGIGLSLTIRRGGPEFPNKPKLLLLAIFASRATVNSKSTSMGRASVMPTRNVNLTDELDRFVAKKVKTGRYENASEVVRAGLRTLEREEQQYEAKIAALKAAIDAGDASGIAEGNVFGRVRRVLKLPVSPR